MRAFASARASVVEDGWTGFSESSVDIEVFDVGESGFAEQVG